MMVEIGGKRPGMDVRDKLLHAALQLFTKKGYAATTVREIVADAGVTKPALYYYFGSKEGIYTILMQRLFDRLEAMFDSEPEKRCGIRDRFLELADRMFGLVVENREAFRLMHAIYYGPPQGAPFFDFDAYFLRYHEDIRKIVAQGIESGELAPGNDEDIAWALMSVAQATIEEQICNRAAMIDLGRMKRMIELIFRGIENKP